MTQQETNRTVQQVLDQLLAEGKQTGKLASSHMLDALDAIDAKPEELEHFYDALTAGGADAALAASLFHYKELEIMDLKAYLAERGIPMRM